MKPILHPEIGLYQKDNHAYCDSLQIAKEFDKEHKEVLKTIEGESRDGKHIDGLLDWLIQSGVNTPDYFIKMKYKDSRNRNQPKYLCTRDGFLLMVMGFTGQKAFMVRLAFIQRFNQMEQFIKDLYSLRIEHPAFTKAIRDAHETPKPYHYSNETDMIYRIVLGADKKNFCATHSIPKEQFRQYLAAEQIQDIMHLQLIDIGLLEAGLSTENRKNILTAKHQKTRALAS